MSDGSLHTRQQLSDGFRSLGVRAGDVVMLHASVRAVGEVAGGPDEIHLALKDVLTPEGTLMMYAGCPAYVDEVGRGHLTPEQEAEILETLPPFDALTARSARDHGALVELLRTYPESHVNAHPARFVAWGRRVPELFAFQPWDYAFGVGSALERLVSLDGKILLLGSDHDAVTFLHHVEHVTDFPGKRVARFKVPVLEGGRRMWKDMVEFDTSGDGVHPNWPDRFFAQIVDGYLRLAGNDGARVGDAPSHYFPARSLLEYAGEVMKGVAADAGAAEDPAPRRAD